MPVIFFVRKHVICAKFTFTLRSSSNLHGHHEHVIHRKFVTFFDLVSPLTNLCLDQAAGGDGLVVGTFTFSLLADYRQVTLCYDRVSDLARSLSPLSVPKSTSNLFLDSSKDLNLILVGGDFRAYEPANFLLQEHHLSLQVRHHVTSVDTV